LEGVGEMGGFKLFAIWLTIVFITVVGIFYGLTRFFPMENESVQTLTPPMTIEEILEKNKSDMEKVKADLSKITKADDVYDLIHKMANTLTVAEDGKSSGEIPVNKETVMEAMVIVNTTDVINKDEKAILLNCLNRWKNGDYSNAVEEHNYVWRKLGGTVGKAVRVKDEYKK
jgi:hypothetical protein